MSWLLGNAVLHYNFGVDNCEFEFLDDFGPSHVDALHCLECAYVLEGHRVCIYGAILCVESKLLSAHTKAPVSHLCKE